MTHDEYLATIRSEADTVLELARTAPLDTMVPTCPKWTIEKLIQHIGGAHRFALGNLGQAPDEGAKLEIEQRPDGQPVTEWLETGVTRLLDRLSSTDPSQPCWTLNDDRVSGFWARRAANETAVHRWDAQNAVGAATPIAAEQAVDGIDEYLGLVPAFAQFSGNGDPWGEGETIHFHATDAPGEWLVRLNADGIEVTKEHAKGDVAARGPASDLFLMILGRTDPSRLEVFGDASLLDRWQQRAQF